MSESRSLIGKVPMLPAGAGLFVKRRLIEIAGFAVFALGFALLVALLSYSPEDPSLNRATNQAAQNLLGRPGAIAADLLLQSLGAAAGLAGVILLSWGWRLMADRALPLWWLRVSLLPVTLLLAAMSLAAIGAPTPWPRPLDANLGGALGATLLGGVVGLSHRIGLGADAVGTAAASLSAVALFVALAFTWGEWRALGRGGAWIASMSGRGLRRLANWRPRDPADRRADEKAARRERVEPRLDGKSAALELDEAPPPLPPEELVEREPAVAKKAVPPKKSAPRQPALDLAPSGDYRLPPLELLEKPPATTRGSVVDDDALARNARLLETVLDDFGIKGQIVKVRPGPVVTLYELEPAPGTKTSRVIGLADDIARSMSAVSVRVAVIPGRNVIGIELPNATREVVYLRALLSADEYERTAAKLTLVLGKDIGGIPMIVDLARMPHLLIAGTTGSGKSVAINTMILSLLYRLPPDECRFIMIDPKMLELSVYDGIPHLLTPVVTEPKKAVVALKWAVREMENRYRAMSKLGVRNIAGYNARLAEARRKGETLTRQVQTGFHPETGEAIFEEQPLDLSPFPFIVVIVDEMADLMLVAGKDIEWAVQRLAQMARAAGLHLIMATQRPSVDVITGTIKANFPTRISFQVTSKIDSRTILGEQGAEQLLGQGDMLYMAGGGRITRIHGPFVSDEEVETVVNFIKRQGTPAYMDDVTAEDQDVGGAMAPDGQSGGSGDDLYDQAVALVCRERKASTSFIQRHLQIGYNRAARLIERMEEEGVVGTANHVGKREVLAPKGDYNE